MSELNNHPKVKQFMQQVCAPVKAKELHSEIKLELMNHLADLVDDRMNTHGDKEEVIEQAIYQMGDPILIGKQFHKAHRPRMEWRLLGITIIFIALGLIAMYGTQLALVYPRTLLFAKIVFTCIGILIMVLFYYFDYRKLKPYSWVLYFLILLLMVITIYTGYRVNGFPYLNLGIIQINFISLTPFLFMIALAGIMTSPKWGGLDIIKKFILFVLLPGLVYLKVSSLTYFAIYFLSFMVLVYFSKKNWKEFFGILVAFITIFLMVFISSEQYIRERVIFFLNPLKDPLGAGYQVIKSIEAIQSAGIWGKGYGSSLATLPAIHHEMIFTYLIYSLGWFMGIAIVIAVLFFVFTVAGIAKKSFDSYGKMLVMVLLSVFIILFFWNMLMSVGLMPMTGLSFPFVSFGSTHYIFELAFVGVILSVYRRKYMIRKEGLEPENC